MTYHKLNLGCGVNGEAVYPSYLNVELTPGKGVDLVADIRWLTFKPGCIDEILLQDVFEHFTLQEATELLPEFYRWLKTGGVICISVPNIKQLAYILFSSDNHEALKWIYGADGSRGHVEPSFHHWIYSRQSLTKMLNDVGFRVLKCWTDCFDFRLCMIAQKIGEKQNG